MLNARIVHLASRVLALFSLSVSLVGQSQTALHSTTALERMPYSGGVLMARAIAAGRVAAGPRTLSHLVSPSLSCSPSPCVLPPVQASEGGNPVNETPISVNAVSPNQLLSGGNDYNCVSLQGFFASRDSGSSWSHTCLGVLPGLVGAGDPVVAWDRNGTAYAGGIDADSSFSSGVIVVAKSSNGGRAFGLPVQAVPNTLGGVADKPWMEIDTVKSSPFLNRIYVSATQFDSGSNSQISVSHSSDGGTTWTTANVDTLQTFPNVDQFSDLAVDGDGFVYVTWMRCTANGPAGDCGGTVASMMFSKSTDGGNSWSSPVVIAQPNLVPDDCQCAFYGNLPNTAERVSNIPSIAVDTFIGRNQTSSPYAVFYNWNGHIMQVQMVHSTDVGNSWGAPFNVSPSGTHDQFFPWVSANTPIVTVASAAVPVAVTWLDRRNDPSNISYQPFVSFLVTSTTFAANIPETTVLSNPNDDGFGGLFMGDYTTNAWAGITPRLYHSWMDTRTGVSQDWVGGMQVLSPR